MEFGNNGRTFWPWAVFRRATGKGDVREKRKESKSESSGKLSGLTTKNCGAKHKKLSAVEILEEVRNREATVVDVRTCE